MTPFLFFCCICLYSCSCTGLTWNESVLLPEGAGWIYAAAGWNRDYTKIYLIGGLNSNNLVPSTWIYQFDGIRFTTITSIGSRVYKYQMSTTVNDIIYYYSDLNKQYIYTYNTAVKRTGHIAQENNGNLTCITSNVTHLFLVYYIVDADFDVLLIYNIKHQKWSDNTGNSPLTGGTFCAYYHHYLYIFGVEATNINSNKIMTYSDINNEWNVSLLNQSYTTCGRVVIMPQNDGIIYILGGYDSCSSDAKAVSSVDVFDANKMSITHCIGLTQKRGQPMIGLINGKIFVIGGNSKSIQNVSPLQATEMSSNIPTNYPTNRPSNSPTHHPTKPTKNPTNSPTNSPTKSPTHHPTNSPSKSPTKSTAAPTYHPTKPPTQWKAEILITTMNLIYLVSGILGVIICCMICRCCKKARDMNNNYVYDDDDGHAYDMRATVVSYTGMVGK